MCVSVYSVCNSLPLSLSLLIKRWIVTHAQQVYHYECKLLNTLMNEWNAVLAPSPFNFFIQLVFIFSHIFVHLFSLL